MKRWSKEEIKYLKENYPKNYNKTLSEKLNRSSKAISYMATKLRLKKERNFYCEARKKTKIKFSKDLIRRLYYKEKKSTRKIAKELGVGKTTIEYYLKKFKITRRSHSASNKIRFLTEDTWTKGLTKETDSRIKKLADNVKKTYAKKRQLRIKEIEKKFNKPINKLIQDLYWEKELNQDKIADKLEVDRSLVIELMRKFKIPKRPNYQYISSLKGKNHPLYGKTWDQLFGKEDAKRKKKEQSKISRERIIKRIENNEFPFFDTLIEKIMAKELLKRDIFFIKQFRVANKFVCDFAIPYVKIIIECDGDYWHANPKIYDKDELTKAQQKKVKTDKIKDEFLEKRGWRVLRFFESDIKSDVLECIYKIEKTIKRKTEELKKIKSPIDSLME